MMRKALIATAGLAAIAWSTIQPAEARFISRVAASGVNTMMYRYHSWNRECQANGGVVKVLAKPSHGKLTPRSVASHVRRSRFTGHTPCEGAPLIGFEVDYRSTPGFHGTDSFAIEVLFGNGRSDTDTFSVEVE